MKWIVAIACLLVAGFCAFGFLATFEGEGGSFLAFRIGYAVVGLACLAGIVYSLVPRSRS
jgi:uncharacterized membrane protein YuzA (DUF378 family)